MEFEKNNLIKSEYESELFDLKRTVQRLQNECDQKDKLHKEVHSEYESFKTGSTDLENELITVREQNDRLKQTHNVLQQEITNLETQSLANI